MIMSAKTLFRDALYRLAQIGTTTGMQLVRITELQEGNLYTARAIEFDDNGETQFAEEIDITVTNLGERADVTGQVPAGTDAVALDVEGRWIVFLRQPDSGVSFSAKVVNSQGSAVYTMREQVRDSVSGDFGDKPGTSNFSASNLAELSLGPGAAVDVGTIALTTALFDNDDPPNMYYVFDHPAYAKYLD